ncbi:Type IV pilus assembly PilZ domain protein [Candidatus Magnetomorum sp. HK-1]|nr:Type IV pilus assembly PilZ domain protein [Candidatus Magnetomorum sp. HK-1]
MFVEKRKHARLNIQLEAKIEDKNGNFYHGKTHNISFGGLFIKVSPITLEKGDDCNITLLLNKEEAENVIPLIFKCKIVHVREKGYGVQYICIEGLEAYDHFEKLMILNSEEPDRLMAELDKHPGLIVKN